MPKPFDIMELTALLCLCECELRSAATGQESEEFHAGLIRLSLRVLEHLKYARSQAA